MKKVLSWILRILLIKAMLVVLIFVAFFGCMYLSPDSHYHTEDPAEYLQISGHITNEGMELRSGLFVFPESIEGLEDAEYHYTADYDGFFVDYMIYLKAAYSDEEYAAEVERLSSITCTVKTPDETVVNSVLYSEDLFNYPAYITIYNCDLSHEYALLDEANNTIVYVYVKQYKPDGTLPQEYFPLEFMNDEVLGGIGWGNQNIYYAPHQGNYCYYR